MVIISYSLPYFGKSILLFETWWMSLSVRANTTQHTRADLLSAFLVVLAYSRDLTHAFPASSFIDAVKLLLEIKLVASINHVSHLITARRSFCSPFPLLPPPPLFSSTLPFLFFTRVGYGWIALIHKIGFVRMTLLHSTIFGNVSIRMSARVFDV